MSRPALARPSRRSRAALAVLLMLGASGGLLVAAGVPAAAASQPARELQRFRSPSGRFEVALRRVEVVQTPDHLEDHWIYRVTFSEAATGRKAGATDYHDVWAITGKHASPREIFRAIAWSPREDLAIMGEEGWMGQPESPSRVVVALRPGLPYKQANMTMDHPVLWIDELRALGNVNSQVGHSAVDLFDGRTGKSRPFKQAKSPLGYQLELGQPPRIKKVLDCNQTEADKARFAPECLTLDPKTLALTPGCR